jgi:hypothetical protein
MIEGEDIALRRLFAYEKRRGLKFTRLLGSGIHGVVYEAESNAFPGFVAVKAHRYHASFTREKLAYQRLRESNVFKIRTFNLPQLIAWDDEWLVIEISIVSRPRLLDFAETWLDEPPELPESVWEDENAKIREQFGDRANEVFRVLAVLRSHGLFMFDVSPSNLAFA